MTSREPVEKHFDADGTAPDWACPDNTILDPSLSLKESPEVHVGMKAVDHFDDTSCRM